ncbi:MAG: InlB B-repeat-containing protein, partial [Raoultibacter sp.]
STYEIAYVTNGGNAVTPHTAPYGSKLTKPTCTKVGHTLEGWYTEAACTNKWDFAVSTVTGATTLYAKWSANIYTVTFQSNEGSPVDATTATFDNTIAKPTDPTRQGYAFAGWYRNQSLTIAWDFASDKVQNDTDLWAKWTAIVDIDVPLDPKISIDAQGKVTTGADATRSFVSRSPKPVLVTGISCTSTTSTASIFPDTAQWPGIKITLVDPTDPYGGIGVRINRNAQASFTIPAAVSPASAELPIEFGLSLPRDIKLSYTDTQEGLPIATLSYTFEFLS